MAEHTLPARLGPEHQPRLAWDDDEARHLHEVLARGAVASFGGGPEVAAYERAWEEHAGGGRRAVVASTGTAALHCALQAAGVGAGDEVIMPAHTHPASVTATLALNAIPIFADIRADDLLMDPVSVAELIGERTKAIVLVHLYGAIVDPAPIRAAIGDREDIVLVEDAAQAHGARADGLRAGTIAPLAAFSTGHMKLVNTGEGGVVLVDPERASPAFVRRLTLRGKDKGAWHFEHIGYSYGLTEVQAAMGRIGLARLDRELAERRAVVRRFVDGFAGTGIEPIAGVLARSDAYYRLPLWLPDAVVGQRVELFQALRDRGVSVMAGYPCFPAVDWIREKRYSAWSLSGRDDVAYDPDEVPVARDVHGRVFSLTTGAALSDEAVALTTEIVRQEIGERS